MIEHEERAFLPLVMPHMQTAIVNRVPPEPIEDRGEAPIGRWTKVIAFTIGLSAALGGYMLVMPRGAALIRPASASEVVAAPASTPATPSLGAANAVAENNAPAHKASRAHRRHAHKHRTASRH
jgi:hypothetical protein